MASLIIDIGNTFYKIYVFEGEDCQSFKTKNSNSAIHYINQLLENQTTIADSIVSSVKSDKDSFFLFLKNTFNEIITFDRFVILPIDILYKTPQSLGKDRLAAVCGAVKLFPGKNLLIIDAGTAITYDFVEQGKAYVGGNISPGLTTRYKSLNTFTDNLPLLDINYENNIFLGQTSKEAIECGVQNGVLFEMETYICRLKEKHPDLITIITGGDAFFFEKSLKNSIFVVENLTALGLKKILELNA